MYRPAVITPFYKEDLSSLSRCHASVVAQAFHAHHIMVGDGVSTSESLFPGAEFITLGANNSDNGNTPRAIGAIAAASRGFFPIFFLDADNWFRNDHIEVALACFESQPGIDVVISRRTVILDDGYVLGEVPEDCSMNFADTSCYCFFPTTYNLLQCWALMPKDLSPICDRVMFRTLEAKNREIAWTGQPTCFFESHYSSHYLLAKRSPREKLHDPDWKLIEANMPTLVDQYFRCTGVRISSPL